MQTLFNPKTCKIPTIYCGKGSFKTATPHSSDIYYVRKGTAYECIKKGVAAGIFIERKKILPKNSLQHIKYVGEKYEKKFKAQNIKTLLGLIKYAKIHTINELSSMLRDVFKKTNKAIDTRAYNSTLMFLYTNGVGQLPKCVKIKAV